MSLAILVRNVDALASMVLLRDRFGGRQLGELIVSKLAPV